MVLISKIPELLSSEKYYNCCKKPTRLSGLCAKAQGRKPLFSLLSICYALPPSKAAWVKKVIPV
jgi:hypothetical protein